MITEASIENFKGIKHCEVKDLAKVNLFIGKNNCGKSSIMEAMYYTGKEFIGTNLLQCLTRRAARGNWSARELWYDYDMSPNINVALGFNEQNFAEMTVAFSPQEDRVAVLLGSGSPKYGKRKGQLCLYSKTGFGLATGRSHVEILSPNPREILQYFDRSVFIDPTVKTEVRQIEGIYLNVLKLSEKASSEMAKRVAEVYDTEPSWEFLPHQDYSPDNPSRFAVLEGGRRLFVDNFGDGFHYGLAVLAAAKTRTKTALFIEEIESHQHSGSLSKLIRHLVRISRDNNLQVFLSTHSMDVWETLHRGVYADDEAKEKEEFRCFLIEKNVETGEVTSENTYDVQKITKALE